MIVALRPTATRPLPTWKRGEPQLCGPLDKSSPDGRSRPGPSSQLPVLLYHVPKHMNSTGMQNLLDHNYTPFHRHMLAPDRPPSLVPAAPPGRSSPSSPRRSSV